jgi:hypothetical protein
LLAVAVAVHQLEQLFDVACADVDHDVVDALQEFLQLCELPAADRHGLAVVGVDALHRDDLAARDPRGEQVAGNGGLADVAREVDDGEFHVDSLVGNSGLLGLALKNASAISRPVASFEGGGLAGQGARHRQRRGGMRLRRRQNVRRRAAMPLRVPAYLPPQRALAQLDANFGERLADRLVRVALAAQPHDLGGIRRSLAVSAPGWTFGLQLHGGSAVAVRPI